MVLTFHDFCSNLSGVVTHLQLPVGMKDLNLNCCYKMTGKIMEGVTCIGKVSFFQLKETPQKLFHSLLTTLSVCPPIYMYSGELPASERAKVVEYTSPVFDQCGYSMTTIHNAVGGKSCSRGGLNCGDIEKILHANRRFATGTRDDLSSILWRILP